MRLPFTDLLQFNNLNKNRVNHFMIQKCNNATQILHRGKMRRVCEWLVDNGFYFVNEAKFKTGGRADIVTNFMPFSEEGKIGSVIEIVNTEKETSLLKKAKMYPKCLRLIIVKAETRFKEELLK